MKVNSKDIFFSQNKLNNLAVFNLLYSWTNIGLLEVHLKSYLMQLKFQHR